MRPPFSRTDPQGTTVRAEKRLRCGTQGAADNADDMDGTGGGKVSLSGG